MVLILKGAKKVFLRCLLYHFDQLQVFTILEILVSEKADKFSFELRRILKRPFFSATWSKWYSILTYNIINLTFASPAHSPHHDHHLYKMATVEDPEARRPEDGKRRRLVITKRGES
jgi:hypothetical protein